MILLILTALNGGQQIYRFPMPVIDSNMYILISGRSCLIVDPNISEEVGNILEDHNITDCLVLLTHEHYDHISGVNWLRGLAKCNVVCSKTCAERIRDPKKNHSAYFESLFFDRDEQTRKKVLEIADMNYSCQADTFYTERLEFEWNGMKIVLVETPGHSPGSQVIRLEEKNYFTGDYLIPGEEVITRLPGGNKRQYKTITRPYLDTIEPSSMIFPGHGEPGIISDILAEDNVGYPTLSLPIR